MSETIETRRRSGDDAAHRETVSESFQSVTVFLSELLGTRLVAHIADSNESTVRRWAAGTTTPKNDTAEYRLRAAHQVARMLLQSDANHTVRAWFIGMNPQLDDVAPATALRDDRLQDVLASARAFLDGA